MEGVYYMRGRHWYLAPVRQCGLYLLRFTLTVMSPNLRCPYAGRETAFGGIDPALSASVTDTSAPDGLRRIWAKVIFAPHCKDSS
jgi:hypothetical protein